MTPEQFDALVTRCRLYALLCLADGDEQRADYWMGKAAELRRLIPQEVQQCPS